MVKKLESLFFGDEVYVESHVMCVFVGILWFEVWDRGNILGV